jgi:hypothetical protein
MDTQERDNLIHKIGHELAKSLGGFWGSITLNFGGDRYNNANIVESIKPEKQEKKHD